MTPTGIERAVQAAGSISALSRALKISHQVANRWHKRGHVPVERALEIEALYGVPARELVDPAVLQLANLITS